MAKFIEKQFIKIEHWIENILNIMRTEELKKMVLTKIGVMIENKYHIMKMDKYLKYQSIKIEI
jgi:uncharacterized membrane protein